jgi:hypothetical protein
MSQIKYEEILTADELRKVHDTVDGLLRKAASMKPSPFSYYGWCDRCPGTYAYKRMHLPKQPCIARPDTGEAICAACWAKEKEKELLDRLVEAKKPKLDLEDFAKV